ncbi:hypothetical protein PMI09_01371 [Rhizobium sp. CF122]|nr:hypothetical protein PMI09_01371 [Rhizobium sp. CF122]
MLFLCNNIKYLSIRLLYAAFVRRIVIVMLFSGARRSASDAIIAMVPKEISAQIVPPEAKLKGTDWNAVFQIWNEFSFHTVGITP